MKLFSISQLSKFSGIKPHTIRIWEQRYNALQPNRSEGNTRYYDNSQLRRLLNIVSLAESDHKISELCTMTDSKLFRLIDETLQQQISNDETTEYFILQLIAAGMSYDEMHLEKILSHCMLRYGLKDVYIKVVYPMLVRIGLLWASDAIPPAQEHFISNMLRQKLYTCIDLLPPPTDTDDTWLLFLPEDEIHDIGLLFSHYLIRRSGRKVIYLGAHVPMQSLINAVRNTNPHNLLLFLVHHNFLDQTNEYLDELGTTFNKKNIYVAMGPRMITDIEPRKQIHVIRSVDDLEQLLQ